MNIGIVIPAYNEQHTIGACLAAIKKAASQLSSMHDVSPLVVLDSCTDETLTIVQSAEIDYSQCQYKCVGEVRDYGIRQLIAKGCDWIACSDADSLVEQDWLVQQIRHVACQHADMICGVVSIQEWDHLKPQTRENYLAHYQDKMGHQHIHGANLSFSSAAYLAVGGFDTLPCHEDVELVKKFTQHGFRILWSNKVRVTTSSRLETRTSQGFAAFLNNLEKDV